MASPIVGGKRRAVRAELQKKGKNNEADALSGMKKEASKPAAKAKKAKKKSAY